jgi:hypothetical protein
MFKNRNFLFKTQKYFLILANYFSIGRLPQQAKDFFNYIRDNSIDLLKSTPGLVG